MNANKLKAKMVENGYTINKLANLLGVTPTTVSIKMRDDGFKVVEARAICKALGLTMGETHEIFFA